jgi:hypothetical protein
MSTSAVSGMDPTSVGQEVTVRLAKMSQNVQQQQGEDAVALIEAAVPPAPGPDGKGAHLNTYA